MDVNKVILNVLDGYIWLTSRIPYKIMSGIKRFPRRSYFSRVCKAFSDDEYDISCCFKPGKPDYMLKFPYRENVGPYAIVLQGPIRNENNFTIQTALYYKNMYRDAIVIVSTWEGESREAIRKLKDIGVEVVLCKKPLCTGNLNVNLQLTSTLMGLRRAKELGAKYVAKTRTDQRLDKAHIFEYCINLIKLFPPVDTENQCARLICLSINYGNMFYPYFISDFFYFGFIDDMIKLFDIPLDTRESFVMKEKSSRREYAEKMYAPEVYIMVSYLEKLGHKCDFTVRDYWETVKNYLICIDRKTINLQWPKYESKYQENAYNGDFFFDDDEKTLKTMNFDFVNWLNLYSGTLQYSSKYEDYANVIFK